MVYGYDGQKRVTSAQAANGNGTYQNSYAYANDRLSSVSHNTTGSGAEVTYSFGYDGLGKPTTVSVGSQVLSVNEYDGDRHQKLRKVSYGNGQNVENRYDSYERVTGKKYGTDSGWRYEYAYAANGEVARVKDNQLNRVAWTEYDEANRVEKMTVQDGSGWMVYRTVLRYDKLEHVSSQKEEVGGGQFLTTYAYDWDDRVTQVGYGSDAYRIRYTYDSQGRLSKRRVNDGSADQTATYSYLASGVAIPGLDTNPSTNLVSGISQPGVSFGYGYASNTDNIVSETRTGGSYAGTTTYGYDSLGQLTRVNDPVENATWIYNYDRGGNMVSKVKYAYTTGGLGAAQQSIGYAYGDANWKDKLTAYNGVGITYDAIGNVTGDGTWTYVWEGGRQLKGMSYSGASVTYDYDHNGQRVRKVVNGVETKYWVNGAKVVHVVRGSDWLHVYYDGQGRPGITNYNGAIYYYLYNLQGDVIGLVDGSGNVVVEYKYDAWGKVIGKTGNLANTLGYLNPFRYRGYVYDEETGLYYLRSRYYNPGWGRFINADVVMGQVGGLLSHNVFAYCGNNPIALEDPDGDVALAILGYEAVGGLAAFVSAVTWMSSREHWDDFAIRNPMPKMSLDPWDASRSWIVSAELAVFAQLAGFDNKRKPINLPSSRRITLNMDHIMSGHGSGGKRGGPNKDRFPEWVTVQIAERIIRTAYKYGERVSTQGDRVFVRGPWDPGRIIEMWVNIVEKVIESAWPKY